MASDLENHLNMRNAKHLLKIAYQRANSHFLTPLIYRAGYLLHSNGRLETRGMYLPLAHECIEVVRNKCELTGLAAFNTSIMSNEIDSNYIILTRVSNVRFGKMARASDWNGARSLSAYSTARIQGHTIAVEGHWRILELEHLNEIERFGEFPLEDLRLFSWKGKIHATANLQLRASQGMGYRPCLMRLNLAGCRMSIDDLLIFDETRGLKDLRASEKNWCPLVDDESRDLFFLRYFMPQQLFRYDEAQGLLIEAYVEQGEPNVIYRSPSSPIRVLFDQKPRFLGIVHTRASRPRNYEYATTYTTRFYLRETRFPFKLVGITVPIRFNTLPRGFIYPFQIAPIAQDRQTADRVIISVNIHDATTILFLVDVTDIFRRITWKWCNGVAA